VKAASVNEVVSASRRCRRLCGYREKERRPLAKHFYAFDEVNSIC
jgi:hypothetical protein